jgi:hypothetical protein
MSMFLCPLCGKQNSIGKFHPETFDDDVEIFHNASLGYRKGFEKIMGFDLSDFPELREILGNRIIRIAEFLELPQETDSRIKELEQKLETEKAMRIKAEEELEEQDLDLLLHKVNSTLGQEYTWLHSAVDELILRAVSINKSNQKLISENKNIQYRFNERVKAHTHLVYERDRLNNENNDLRAYNNQWSKAYRDLETQKKDEIKKLNQSLTTERNRREALADELEELDLDILLRRVNNKLEKQHTKLHSAINELIHKFNSSKREIENALEFINKVLPDEYDEFYDLDEALEALYQYYEDQIEELSDE